MNWKDDISDLARGWMELLGDFGPTVNEQKRELKGYLHDDEGGGKAYLDSGELREIAASCIEVANWLDDRADKTANAKSEPTAPLLAQVGSTDGLGVAVPPAPTIDEEIGNG